MESHNIKGKIVEDERFYEESLEKYQKSRKSREEDLFIQKEEQERFRRYHSIILSLYEFLFVMLVDGTKNLSIEFVNGKLTELDQLEDLPENNDLVKLYNEVYRICNKREWLHSLFDFVNERRNNEELVTAYYETCGLYQNDIEFKMIYISEQISHHTNMLDEINLYIDYMEKNIEDILNEELDDYQKNELFYN